MLYNTHVQNKLNSIAGKEPVILGIETSCDDTSVAVLRGEREVLSLCTNSQIMIHREFGGVVPEIASRNHVKNIVPVTLAALEEAKLKPADIDAIAITSSPGLLGALLSGLNFAKGLAFSLGIPYIGVNHICGHISANYLSNKDLKPPFICLVASGGHSQVVHVKSYSSYEILGGTCDDAAGESLDKVARLLGLPYPGGPALEELAIEGNEKAYDFKSDFNKSRNPNFSFSGVKTAVMNLIENSKARGTELNKADIAASFQRAVMEALAYKTMLAARSVEANTIAIAAGLSANTRLRKMLTRLCDKSGLKFVMPEMKYCMDNGAMENFFGRLKVEMFYGEKFESVNAFIEKLNEYIYYYNNERISTKLKGMSPVQYRTHSLAI